MIKKTYHSNCDMFFNYYDYLIDKELEKPFKP